MKQIYLLFSFTLFQIDDCDHSLAGFRLDSEDIRQHDSYRSDCTNVYERFTNYCDDLSVRLYL